MKLKNKKKKTPKNIQFHTKVIEISHDNLEAALLQFLHSNRLIPLEWEVLEVDFGIPVNNDGNIELDMAYVIPKEEESHLTLAIDNTKVTLFNV